MTKSDRIRAAAFLWFALIIIGLSATLFALSVGRPYMGTMLSRRPEGWVVESVDPNGLATLSGIGPGDIPVEINGQPAAAFLAKYAEQRVVFGRLLKELTVVDENGATRTASFANASQSQQSAAELLASFLVSLIFWSAALYVYLKKPGELPALLLCLASLAVGLGLSAQMAGERAVTGTEYLEVGSALFGPWLLVHFFLVLPEERRRVRASKLVYLIYLVPAITLGLFRLVGYADGQPSTAFRSLRFVEYGVGFVGAVGVAALNYVRAGSPRTRQQMKIVLISALAALIPFLVIGIMPAALWHENLLPYGFNIVFIAFIPLGMGYAVVTRSLMDIDVVIRRGIIYGLISLVMAAILSVGILVVGVFRPQITPPEQILMAVCLGVVAAVLFGPAKKGIETIVDKAFYKDRYDYRQTIHTLSTSLNNSRESSEISRLVVATAAKNLNLCGVCLFVKGPSGRLEVGAAQGTLRDGDAQARLLARLVPGQRDSAREFPNAVEANDCDVSFMIPLAAGSEEAGVLCLTNKTSRQGFSSNDLFLLQGIAFVAATALRSAALIRDVSVRDTFVSVASHELNTPLTAILGYSELLLRRDSPDPNTKRWLQRIYDSGKRISSMVDDLLNVTRIQSGRIGLKLEAVNVDELLEEKLSMASETSAKHQFSLEAYGCAQVFVDRDKFGQIVWNLLNNAVKYSPKGGAVVVGAREDEHRHRVIVSVSDEGMGIAPEDRKSLFKTFHRIQRPETVGIRGSGLGLYIVKEWTEAMGGEVWVESELNKGSTFFVAVPTADSAKEERPEPAPGI